MKQFSSTQFLIIGTFLILATYLILFPIKGSAVPNTSMTGKCVSVMTTASIIIDKTTEGELNSIQILNFDTGKYSAITTNVDKITFQRSREMQVDRSFFISPEDAIPGMFRMTFGAAQRDTFDPSKDHIILVPSNSSNTIFMMDPITGGVGVCQKL